MLCRAREREPNHDDDFGGESTLGIVLDVGRSAGTIGMELKLDRVSTEMGVLGIGGDCGATNVARPLKFASGGEFSASEPAAP